MLHDDLKVHVRAGSGGAGSLHFRREKHVPLGGPDGGDGGRGGSIVFVAKPTLNTLYRYVRQRHFAAEDGGGGSGSRRHGKSGETLTLYVPTGTVIRDAETDEVIADLEAPEAQVIAARGGRGGLGNTHFATSTNQTPQVAERGEPGEERWIMLELKLIADVGIVGLPNAGKSTLLSHISAARPKIAEYPFTTLSPNLGVVDLGDDRTLVAADIPGLIEGAHTGAGLGHEFLRHVERTAVFIHLLDASAGSPEEILHQFATINQELELYQEDLSRRPMVVGLNKMDLPEAQENLPALRRALEGNHAVYAISGVSGEGLKGLLEDTWSQLQGELLARADRPRELPAIEIEPFNAIDVERVPGGFRVHSRRAERAAVMTDPDQPEGMDRLQELMRRFGVTTALEKAGAQPGDAVHIGQMMLLWGE